MGWLFYTDRRVKTYADEKAEIARLCSFETDTRKTVLVKASKVGSTWYAAAKVTMLDGTPVEDATYVTDADGRDIPVRWIGEQHVREDCQGRIPSLADWFTRIQPEPWMANGQIDRASPEMGGDPREAWMAEVASGRTVLGLQDWLDERTAEMSDAAQAPTSDTRSEVASG
ncbi:MAG: hypothetical protein AAGG56_17370 [Pseudomonadota bacterium]